MCPLLALAQLTSRSLATSPGKDVRTCPSLEACGPGRRWERDVETEQCVMVMPSFGDEWGPRRGWREGSGQKVPCPLTGNRHDEPLCVLLSQSSLGVCDSVTDFLLGQKACGMRATMGRTRLAILPKLHPQQPGSGPTRMDRETVGQEGPQREPPPPLGLGET